MITEGDRGRTGATDFGEYAQKNAPKTDYSAQPETGGLTIGARSNTTSERELTVATGEEVRTNRFALVGWGQEGKELRGYAWTTHPTLLQTMLAEGPRALEAEIGKEEKITMTTISLPARPYYEGPRPTQLREATELTIDRANGLLKVRQLQDTRLLQADGIESIAPQQTDNALYSNESEYAYNDPTDLFKDLKPFIISNELDTQIPSMQDAWKSLHFGFSEDGNAYTILLPHKLKTKMDELNETETDSGIYYPKIHLLPTGKIEFAEYLQVYAASKHPVATDIMRYYKHDSATAHIKSFMVYGEMFMEMISQYAQTSLKQATSVDQEQAKQIHEGASHIVDTLTNDLGRMKVGEEALSTTEPQFKEIMMTLQEAGTFDNLQIVQWMRERGMVDAQTAITEKQLKDGFVTYAKGRFKIT